VITTLDTAKIALALFDAGWHPIPLPAGQKGPPPSELTGAAGVDLTREQVAARPWSGNLAVRAATDQLGIDVDAYAGGLVTLRALVAELGPLPRSVVSHSGRNDGSGIYWYRVPVGVQWVGGLPGIQMIQHRHRYAVVWPSTHPDHGGMYGWFDQTEGGAYEGVPDGTELPDLPWAWIERLTRGPLADGTSSTGIAPPAEVATFVAAHADARATRFLEMVLEHFAEQVGAGFSRHDTMMHCLAWAMEEARAGDYPAAAALEALGAAWTTVMDVPRRAALSSPTGRATEWEAMVGWGVRRAQAIPDAKLDEIVDEHQGLQIDDEAPHEEDDPEPEPTSSSSGATYDPADFFTKRGALRAKTLARVLEELGPLAMGEDGRLWRYRPAGHWVADGERVAIARAAALLGEKARPSHASNAFMFIKSRPALITSAQPERWLNCPNGMLDWRTGALESHDPAYLSTHQLQVSWDPAATCPTVDAWLAEVVEDDVVELVWEVVGMAIYAGMPFHRAIMLSGTGRNGKGTLLRLIEALAGERHCGHATLHQLVEDRFVVAGLFGKVCNLAGDLDARAVMSTDTFKMVTGEDTAQVQHKYGQPFDLRNRALMVFAANRIPMASDHSEGYASRWIVVPFQRVTLGVHGSKPEDKSLEPRMWGELPGVLVGAVAGIRRAIARGDFVRPASVTEATEAFHRTSNPLHEFIEDCLEVTGLATDEVSRAGVFAAYQRWCRASSHRALSARRFWPELQSIEPQIDTGVTDANPNGHRSGRDRTRIVLGVRLVDGLWP
jgi:P4 family phage/plasmid primase-like protien